VPKTRLRSGCFGVERATNRTPSVRIRKKASLQFGESRWAISQFRSAHQLCPDSTLHAHRFLAVALDQKGDDERRRKRQSHRAAETTEPKESRVRGFGDAVRSISLTAHQAVKATGLCRGSFVLRPRVPYFRYQLELLFSCRRSLVELLHVNRSESNGKMNFGQPRIRLGRLADRQPGTVVLSRLGVFHCEHEQTSGIWIDSIPAGRQWRASPSVGELVEYSRI